MLDGLRFTMLETRNDVCIELVETKQPMLPLRTASFKRPPVVGDWRMFMSGMERF